MAVLMRSSPAAELAITFAAIPIPTSKYPTERSSAFGNSPATYLMRRSGKAQKPRIFNMFDLALPDTALRIIFLYLERSDLKTARLVSKRWHRLLHPSLFYSSLTINANRRTLDKIEAISLHPKYHVIATSTTISLDSGWCKPESFFGKAESSRLARLVQSVTRCRNITSLQLNIADDRTHSIDDLYHDIDTSSESENAAH